MSDKTNSFPKEHLDAMMRAAVAFDKARLPTDLPWRFDTGGQMDAGESAFIAQQLLYMRPGVFKIEYPELKGFGLVPANTLVPRGAQEYGVEVIDQVGEVKVSRDQAGDTPMVDISVQRKMIPFYNMRLGYRYTQQDAEAAIFARVALNPMKAMAVREQMERKLDDVIFVGETTLGLTGILNQSGTQTYTPTTDGAGAAKTFESKSSDQVLNDLNAPADQVVSNSKEIEVPDTMLLPLTSRNLIARRRVGDGTSSTILDFFTANSKFVRRVEATYKSESNTGWTGKRGLVYRNDPSKVEMVVSNRFDQLPPQYVNFEVVTHCFMRTAGIALYRPNSFCYFDGI